MLSDKSLIEIALSVSATVMFSQFALDIRSVSENLRAQLKKLPKPMSSCRITVGGFKGMWEPGIVVGYMQGTDELKALVVYAERHNEDSNEYDFIPVDRVRPAREPAPCRDILNRNR